ncbi:hypothetical protein Q672_00315 [Marinobacter sp. EVN1]|uniref:WavE lipopolysaccharide synthesis family protein n=1 Tax=Marinobacter sp. EVN1 TaxID=1397532 RepID=UPI0003B8D654|nr:WavE lipopolysaccharide synthesis family protein [Marinobacter sp. EVN1]ERS88668.1 hypothetical protein Q672_00315 [Marinobacter sp. EVN1]
MVSNTDITVVVQGPVQTFRDREQEEGITKKCLQSVRRHLPGAHIILSTWPEQDLTGLDYDELVTSPDPGSNIRYFKVDGSPQTFNNNRQIVSTLEGLKRVKTPYAIKLRSDNFLTGSQFIALQNRYQARSTSFRFLRERVVVSNVFTRKFAKGFPVAYHLSDFFYFGLTEDLLAIWDLNLLENAKDKILENEVSFYSTFPIDCTQMLWLRTLSKFAPDITLRGLLDNAPETLEQSNHIFANNLVIGAPKEIGLGLCKKFMGTARISRPRGRCAQWQHFEWQDQYNKFCKPSPPVDTGSPTFKLKIALQRLMYVYPTRIETIFKIVKRRKIRERLKDRHKS